jgi:TPR repeat protein
MKRLLMLLLLFSASETLVQAQLPRIASAEFPHLMSQARQGKSESQIQLGLAYQYGIGTQPDLQSAEYWLKSAARYGDPHAQTQLGLLYLQPQFRDTHTEQAMQWFLRAAATQFAPAEHNLGMIYLHGLGTPHDDDQALRWFRKAVKHGSAESEVYVGTILLKSSDPARKSEGFAAIQHAAEKGNAKGMNALGYCYHKGSGVTPDLEQARRWYQAAADAGDPDGMHNLSVLYFTGQGVPQDRTRAFELNQKACDRGDRQSCATVASSYVLGEGTSRNYALAYQFALTAGLDKKFLAFAGAGLTQEVKVQAALEAERWQHNHAFQLSVLPQ